MSIPTQVSCFNSLLPQFVEVFCYRNFDGSKWSPIDQTALRCLRCTRRSFSFLFAETGQRRCAAGSRGRFFQGSGINIRGPRPRQAKQKFANIAARIRCSLSLPHFLAISLPAAYSDIDESASVSSMRHQGRHKFLSNFSSTDFSQEENFSFSLKFSKLVWALLLPMMMEAAVEM